MKQKDFSESTVITKLCGNDIRCYMREDAKRYSVVTLGELVNMIVPMMDRSIFMPELKEKKESANYGRYGG